MRAFLWLDRNANAIVDNGSELFGNATRLQNGELAVHGFAALAELDVNADGEITDRDARWSDLRLWCDKNHNGISEASEIASLPAYGVTLISLNYHWTGRKDKYGNTFRYQSKSLSQDKYGPESAKAVYDIFFTRSE